MGTHLLIDADTVIYKAGLSNETREYMAVNESGVVGHRCKYKADMDQWLEDDGGDWTIAKHKWAGPLSHSLANAKGILNKIMDNDQTGHTSYSVYISGENNFRYDVYPDYKGKRKPEDRPIHEQEIREYLIKHWDAEVVDGEEVDDKVSYTQCTSLFSTCIVSIDKDLLNTAGLNYNYDKDLLTDVSPRQADLNFARQLLTGDSTDNIPGLHRVGAKTAEKILPEWRPDWLEVVSEKYEEEFGLAWRERIEMIGQLLWMRRKPEEMWTLEYNYE
jgi:hypothetical protein